MFQQEDDEGDDKMDEIPLAQKGFFQTTLQALAYIFSE